MSADGRFGAAACILVADGDEGVRTLLTDVLVGAGFGVRAVATGTAAVATLAEGRPAAAVLDVNLAGLSGYEVCRALRERFGSTLPIVFVSGERTEPYDRVAGLLIGGDDYLVKPVAPGELLARVRGLLGRLEPAATRNGLTPREHEVLGLLADGLTQAEIATRLVIAPRTVATHIERILEKLGVHSRAEAVAAAYRRALVRA